MSEQPIEVSYFQERMNLLGVTDDNSKVLLWYRNTESHKDELEAVPVFKETDKGIDILVYTLDRYRINYAKEGSRYKINTYAITRLKEPIIKKDGSEMKYLMPKGQPVLPFFPPKLVDKYDLGTTIPILYLTEGYFKAFKAQMHGIDCIGLPSITCMKDRETGGLHEDVKKIIEKCKVQRIVWLTDGDCRNLTGKEITDGADLSKRPVQFFKTVSTFYELLSKYDDVQKYFAHINSDNLEGKPKGLDDLLCAFPTEIDAINNEFASFDKITNGIYNGQYLVKMNITFGVGRVHKYFMLHDVDTFYLHHVELRPEIKNKDFTFYGTLYHYDEEENKCIVKVPSDAKRYFRVGDDFYEHLEIPNSFGALTKTYHKRKVSTIKMDLGNKIFDHIIKFKAFCSVPDHENYQRIINNCFNSYFPFEWEPEDGDCTNTLNFIKHIFGTEPVQLNETTTVERWELGLDYLTLLYKKPQQILPILCLVSNERQTGKTTFANWLNALFTENMAIVSNQDLEGQFNPHWASKLIVACDETKIDKHIVMEKIKALSTACKIMKEGKGVDAYSTEFFGKFLLMSNNEDDFARISAEEIRFWVIKVPTIKGLNNVDLLAEMRDEIPAFLHYIKSRPMITERAERHWFATHLLRTEALNKVVQNSKPTIEKTLRSKIAQLFTDIDELETVTMPFSAIKTDLLTKGFDDSYIKRTLNNMGYFAQKVQHKTFPRFVEIRDDESGGTRISFAWTKFHTTYYEFPRADFADLIDVERGEYTEIADKPQVQQPSAELPF